MRTHRLLIYASLIASLIIMVLLGALAHEAAHCERVWQHGGTCIIRVSLQDGPTDPHFGIKTPIYAWIPNEHAHLVFDAQHHIIAPAQILYMLLGAYAITQTHLRLWHHYEGDP